MIGITSLAVGRREGKPWPVGCCYGLKRRLFWNFGCVRETARGGEHILVKAVAQLVPPWPCTTE
jgi:hypothetical protein